MKKALSFFVVILISTFISGCGNTYTVAGGIPDAENSLFTTDGRLLVTGGTNIYEVNSGKADPLYEGTANFTGMTESKGYVYALAMKTEFGLPPSCPIPNILDPGAMASMASCLAETFTDHVLLAAKIQPGKLNFREIYHLDDVLIPNGMASDGQGNLYIANETFLPGGNILRLKISASDPETVTEQKVWAGSDKAIISPNGMSLRNGQIYFTDFNMFSFTQASVKKIPILADGSAGQPFTLYERTGLFDDLAAGTLHGKTGVAVVDFIKGSVVFLEDTGVKKYSPDYETSAGLFASPSSVRQGNGAGFSSDDLIVTEKGIFYDYYSSYGNKISCLRVK